MSQITYQGPAHSKVHTPAGMVEFNYKGIATLSESVADYLDERIAAGALVGYSKIAEAQTEENDGLQNTGEGQELEATEEVNTPEQGRPNEGTDAGAEPKEADVSQDEATRAMTENGTLAQESKPQEATEIQAGTPEQDVRKEETDGPKQDAQAQSKPTKRGKSDGK